MNTKETIFDLWCIVELFGHQKVAGKCTEQNIAGSNMLRVDVPETKAQGSFTRFYGSAAIYAIHPVTEEIVKSQANSLNVKPVEAWDIKDLILKERQLLEASSNDQEELEDDLSGFM